MAESIEWTRRLLNTAAAAAAKYARPGTDFHDELTAEGLLALVKAVRSYDPARCPGGDLAGYAAMKVALAVLAATGLCVDRRRSGTEVMRHHRRWRMMRHLPEKGGAYDKLSVRDGEESADAADAVEWLRRHLAEDEFRALYLTRGEGRGVAEVARIMGVTDDRASTLWRRALRKARALPWRF